MTATTLPTATNLYEYYKVTLPISADGEKIAFKSCEPIEFEGRQGECKSFTVDRVGRAYFSHQMRLRQFEDHVIRIRELINMPVDQFVETVNARMAELKNIDKQYYIATMGGKLYGILRTYNPISNREILKKVEEFGLMEQVWNFRESDLRFDLFIRGKGIGDLTSYGIVLKNGNTGHVSIGYDSYWKLGDDYFREFPEKAKSRHFSTVSDILTNFDKALEESFGVEVDKQFLAETATWAKRIAIKVADEELKDSSLTSEIDGLKAEGTAVDFMVALTSLSNKTRGSKGRVRKCMDAVVDGVQETVRSRRPDVKEASKEKAPESLPTAEPMTQLVELEAATVAEEKAPAKKKEKAPTTSTESRKYAHEHQ